MDSDGDIRVKPRSEGKVEGAFKFIINDGRKRQPGIKQNYAIIRNKIIEISGNLKDKDSNNIISHGN